MKRLIEVAIGAAIGITLYHLLGIRRVEVIEKPVPVQVVVECRTGPVWSVITVVTSIPDGIVIPQIPPCEELRFTVPQ